MPEFQLDQHLAADTHLVAELKLCRLLLMNDRHFPWLILVPRREGVHELIDLLPGDQLQLWQETAQISRVMQSEFKPRKLNIAMLGNIVPQLHVHLIARFETDLAWPRPVWGVGQTEAYRPEDVASLLARLKAIVP